MQNTPPRHPANDLPETPSSNTAMDLLALGAGIALLLSAGKSRSPIGGLIKGSAATALLGRAAKNTGLLGKAAGFLSGSAKKTRIRS